MSAEVTDEHIHAADCAMYELPLGDDDPAEGLRDALAQLIADAEARGRFQVSAEAMTHDGAAR